MSSKKRSSVIPVMFYYTKLALLPIEAYVEKENAIQQRRNQGITFSYISAHLSQSKIWSHREKLLLNSRGEQALLLHKTFRLTDFNITNWWLNRWRHLRFDSNLHGDRISDVTNEAADIFTCRCFLHSIVYAHLGFSWEIVTYNIFLVHGVPTILHKKFIKLKKKINPQGLYSPTVGPSNQL